MDPLEIASLIGMHYRTLPYRHSERHQRSDGKYLLPHQLDFKSVSYCEFYKDTLSNSVAMDNIKADFITLTLMEVGLFIDFKDGI